MRGPLALRGLGSMEGAREGISPIRFQPGSKCCIAGGFALFPAPAERDPDPAHTWTDPGSRGEPGGTYIISAIPNDPRKAASLYCPCYRQMAKMLHVPFIQAPEQFSAKPETFYFQKDIHLNPAGNTLLAATLLSALQPAIRGEVPGKLLAPLAVP